MEMYVLYKNIFFSFCSFAIWNTMMGTSLLSMPWGITQSGFVLGILLIVGLGILTLYTAYRVLKAKDYLGTIHSLCRILVKC